MATKYTADEILERFKKKHGDRYDYSDVDYKGYQVPVKIQCMKHGLFLQTPALHIDKGLGCPRCAQESISMKNREAFVKTASILYKGKYDYSKVEYFNDRTPVEIICPEHGPFVQRPRSHLAGHECYRCSLEKRSFSRADVYNKLFEEKAKKVHGDKYDYSLSDYKNVLTPVKIICPEHGVFEQTPNQHYKYGCPECGKILAVENRLKRHKEFFEEDARKIHGDKYDYSLVEYKNWNTPVRIICPEHGEFFQKPINHILKKNGCPKCGVKIQSLNRIERNRDNFERDARLVHGDKYDYSLVDYRSCIEKVEIVCPEHGPFHITPNRHLSGYGCRKCSAGQAASRYKEDFESKAKAVHGDKYDYSLVDYKGALSPIKIICPKHGVFEQKPNHHLNGCGCPKCSCTISKGEREVYDFIKSFCKDVEFKKKGLFEDKRFEVDIWIPSKNVGIEYDGIYFHSELFRSKYNISGKQDMADSAGVRLVNVFEDEWQNKRDITESRLKSILGVQEEKIFARKCSIAQITNREARAFLDANHLQGGNAACTFAAGLFYERELVSVMTFCRPRMGIGNGRQSPGSYELLKFASKINLNVVGGASRLLKYFMKNTPDASLIYSFADRRWSDGGLYERLGFERAGASKPDYFYIVGGRRYHRFNFRKSVLVAQGFDPSKSEREIMEEREIPRVYDAGNYKYVLKI